MSTGPVNFAALHVALVCDADATRTTFTGMRAAMTVADTEERADAAARGGKREYPGALLAERSDR